MTRGEDAQLAAAKRAYRTASEEGNRQEEAKWANVIGDIYKNRGEYVVALKWLRIDYEVSIKYLPEKQLLPTCQSLGEIYLRLESFKDALIYQKKHLELAKDSSDEIEQQRACTQLGRTYHEMFLKSDDDHYSVRNAKKYFKSAMNLARSLKENPPGGKSSFIEEYIDAHNNIGMLEMDLDNLEEAQKILMKGLKICDEEEVAKDDAGRSRLHHNLGKIYIELRKWETAREHIENDIMICQRIGHIQGEAKGFINLGELYYKAQQCDEAIRCYQKALKLAKSMEDEDALADQIGQNIETVREAMKVIDELKTEEQILKKLIRKMPAAKGTASERKILLQQNACLDRLIEKASMIFAWTKHRELAKRKKKVANQLCDQEKLSDSFLVIGESYQKLRNFSKALKWYRKSLKIYQLIGSLEGQALAKINIGGVLDSDGDWSGALKTFKEGYEIALQSKLPSVQLSALENVHYSQMIRFDNVDEARRLQLEIDKLKQLKASQVKENDMDQDCCSETESDGSGLSKNGSDMNSQGRRRSKSYHEEQPEDDQPLIMPGASIKQTQASSDSKFRSTASQQTGVGRKRIRVVLSDDEDEMFDEVECPIRRHHKSVEEDVATSDEFKNGVSLPSPARDLQDVSEVSSKCGTSTGTPINHAESTGSYRSRTKKVASQDARDYRTSSTSKAVNDFNLNANGPKYYDMTENLSQKRDAFGLYKQAFLDECSQYVTFKIDEDFVDVDLSSCMASGMLSIECMKVGVACLYYLQLPAEKRSKGLLPIIKHLSCAGKPLETLKGIDAVKDYLWGKGWIEVSINGWIQKRLMKLYIDCCEEQSEPPNLKMLKKLYNLEVSEDEVIVNDCDLQDMSITPLLDALQTYKTVAVIDLSHNSLGNGTAEKLQKVLVSSGQSYGSLVLDLHCNRFGPTALFHICECPVLFTRLEVLNISGNRMTDACGSYLSTILRNCKGLYSLNIERCSITSRTIQKVADSLDSDSVLSQICIGYNNPISANALVNLLGKLATLKRFSDLSINGLKLSKPVIDALCQLSAVRRLSMLMLGDTHIGIEGALQLTESLASAAQELEKLDLSSCGLTSKFIARLNDEVSLVTGILELNLGGNPIKEEGGLALASLLTNPQCSLKNLVLKKCQLGPHGILSVLEALSTNTSLEELNLAGNIESTIKDCSNPNQNDKNISTSTSHTSLPENLEDADLEVADSDDDEETIAKTSVSAPVSSYQEDQTVQDMSKAIGIAENLRLLDLSNNGFSEEAAEELYAAWSSSSGSRGGSAERHGQETTIHFYVEGVRCCGVKPCCRRD